MYADSNRTVEKLGSMPVGPRSMTLRERLTENKKQLEERLAEVSEALAILDKSPDIEHFHNVISKAGY